MDFDSDAPIPHDETLDSSDESPVSEAAPKAPTPGANVEKVEVVSLILDNFKSFERKTTVPFRDGFTTISGPNGSGKSNIIDSVLFVLGLSSSKGMRAERLTDLLNATSSKKYARAALKLRVTYSDGATREIEVARRVRIRSKDNYDSRYEVDGEVKKASELQELLLELGLNPSGMNVVLQGDVMRLTTMSPLNRRRVLDETAGIVEFDKRITAARDELGLAARHMEDISLILTELEGRLEALKDERETALEYRRLREMRGSMEDEIILLGAQRLRDEALLTQRKLEDLQARKTQLKQSYEAALIELEAVKDKLALAEAEVKAKGEGERLTAFKRREALSNRLESIAEGIARVSAGIARQLDAAKARKEELTALEAKSGQLSEKEAELQARLDELGEKHQSLSNDVQKAMAEIRRHGAAQADKIEELNRLQVVTRRQRSRDDELSKREAQLAEQQANLSTERKLLGESTTDSGSRREDIARREAEAATARREAREELAKEEERQRRLMSRVSRLRDDRERNIDKVSEAKDRLARAEEKVRAAQVYTSSLAMRTIQESGIDGILGSVRELCNIEPEHAEAIEAAAGGRLQWVVVRDEHVGKACIELLKRTRAGRLTFVPLTKIQPKAFAYRPVSGRGIINYAIDLVDFAREHQDVFKDVFGETVVVRTLQDALPLMNRYRMVTLDGDLLEKGGRMTGGRRKSSQGRAMAELAAAERIVRESKATISELEATRQALAREEMTADAEARQINQVLSSLKERVAETGAIQLRLKEELEGIDSGLAPAKERLTGVATQLSKVEAELTELRGERARLGEQLQRDDARLAELTEENEGSAFEALSKQTATKEVELRDLEATLEAVRGSFQNLRVERRGLQERSSTLELALEEGEQERAAFAKEAAALEEEKATKAAELTELDAQLGQIARELDALEAKRKAAQEVVHQVETKSSGALREMQAAELGLEAAQEKLARAFEAAQAKLEDVEARGIGPLPDYPEDGYEEGEDPKALSKEVEKELQATTTKMQSLEPVNMLAIDQYDEIAERRGELNGRFETLTSERDGLVSRIEELEEAKRRTFMEAFEAVRSSFKDSFAELAHGEGELRLENEEDPFQGGLIIEARPRGKKFARLEAMSGGEKSLTALAFIFALQSVNPAPFYIFDEVDQSLDGANTELLAVAIQRRSRQRQYFVVSHHQAMLNESDQLLGVHMRKGYGTRVTGIALKKEEPTAAAS